MASIEVLIRGAGNRVPLIEGNPFITRAGGHESCFALRSFCSCRDCKAARALGTRTRNRLAIASSSEHAFVSLLPGCECLGG